MGTVAATDPVSGDSVTGSTLSGTDAAVFAITTAGALSFSSAPDFEGPQGGTDDDSNTYTLTVTATQNLTVTNVNELPGAPRNISASRSGSTWSVSWSAPVHNRGSPITSYKVVVENLDETPDSQGCALESNTVSVGGSARFLGPGAGSMPTSSSSVSERVTALGGDLGPVSVPAIPDSVRAT